MNEIAIKKEKKNKLIIRQIYGSTIKQINELTIKHIYNK